jgi:nitrilase
MKAAAIQMNSGADVAANLDVAAALIAEAAQRGATLVALPENFAFMGAHERDKLGLREALGRGPIQDFLARMARERRLWLVGGTVPLAHADRDDKVYAACLLFSPQGERVAHYDKIHLFDVDVPREGKAESYRESNSIAFGTPRAVVASTREASLGLSVCYDLRFPELYRALAVQGAQVLCVPSAFTERTGAAHWEVLLRARAVENQAFVLAPGQTGTHPGGRRTWGHSMIVDPWGAVLAVIDSEPGVALAELDFARLEEIRTTFPALKHRRL